MNTRFAIQIGQRHLRPQYQLGAPASESPVCGGGAVGLFAILTSHSLARRADIFTNFGIRGTIQLIVLWVSLLVVGSMPAVAQRPVISTVDSVPPSQAPWEELVSRSPWVFLGDSNTYAGGYVAQLEARLRSAKLPVKLLNLGVSSETASGLSEVDHPFKRPCVHERLDKVLLMTHPRVVFVCYGMNDGIYDPPNAERMEAFKAGMKTLAEKVIASGSELIVLTPPIFEPEPVAAKGKFGPTDTGRYAYFAPYHRYDDVLEQQAAWCLSNELHATAVIDIRTLLKEHKQQRLAADPTFAYSKDGVHFGDEAHGLIAKQILTALHAPTELIEQEPTAAELSASVERTKILRDAYLSATGKNRPGLPAGVPVWMAEQIVSEIK